MIDVVINIIGLGILSFSLVYGMYYVGIAMDSIFSYAFGMRDWAWDE